MKTNETLETQKENWIIALVSRIFIVIIIIISILIISLIKDISPTVEQLLSGVITILSVSLVGKEIYNVVKQKSSIK